MDPASEEDRLVGELKNGVTDCKVRAMIHSFEQGIADLAETTAVVA
jgi:hypothetical protein